MTFRSIRSIRFGVTYLFSGLSNGVEEPLDKMDIFLRPRITSKVALTQGDWEVLGKRIWVDEANSIVYFCALREGPLEQHVYAVSLPRPLEIRLLTRPGYSYNSVYFNKECSMLVTVYSSIKTLPTCQVRLYSRFNSIHVQLPIKRSVCFIGI